MSDLPCSPGLIALGSQQVNLPQGDLSRDWVKETRCITPKNSSAGGGDDLQYVASMCVQADVHEDVCVSVCEPGVCTEVLKDKWRHLKL